MTDYLYHKMFLEEKLAYLKAKYETCNLKLKMTPKFLNNRLYDEIYNLSIDIREKEKEIEGLKWRIREEKINEILNEK